MCFGKPLRGRIHNKEIGRNVKQNKKLDTLLQVGVPWVFPWGVLRGEGRMRDDKIERKGRRRRSNTTPPSDLINIPETPSQQHVDDSYIIDEIPTPRRRTTIEERKDQIEDDTPNIYRSHRRRAPNKFYH